MQAKQVDFLDACGSVGGNADVDIVGPEQAEATLEEASGVIANGYLRLDPQEWVRAVEKRRAALGR